MSMFIKRKNSSPKIIVNTIISAASGGITAVFLKPQIMKTFSPIAKFDVGAICNGILGGLVGITAVCDAAEPWAAFAIGVVSGIIYPLFCKLLEKLNIDDPVEASCVHFACGTWGCIATGLFHFENGLFYNFEHGPMFMAN